MNGLANLGAQPEQTVPGFLDRLRELALPKLAKFNDQCVPTNIFVCASIQMQPNEASLSLLECVSPYRQNDQQPPTNRELSNLINALGKWGAHPGGDFLEAFCRSVARRLETFAPQGLAQVLHALGRMNHYPGPEWMAAAVDRCLVLVEGFTAQGLAMVVCGLSNLRFHPGDAALGVLTAAATRRAGDFDQQYLANVWWGTGELKGRWRHLKGTSRVTSSIISY